MRLPKLQKCCVGDAGGRFQLRFVKYKNNRLYATNGMTAATLNLKPEVNWLEGIEKLGEEWFITGESWGLISLVKVNKRIVVEVSGGFGIQLLNKKGEVITWSHAEGSELDHVKVYTPEHEKFREFELKNFPPFKNVTPSLCDLKQTSIDGIGMNPELLKDVQDAMGFETCDLRFFGKNRAIEVYPKKMDSKIEELVDPVGTYGLVMPIWIE